MSYQANQEEIAKLQELYSLNFIQEGEYKSRLAELTGSNVPIESKFNDLSISENGVENTLTSLPQTGALQLNVMIWGDAGVGKTAFVEKHVSGEFLRNYSATQEVKISQLLFKTTIGDVAMNIYDIPGKALQDPSVCPEFQLIEKMQGLILMFDNTSKPTYASIKTILKKLDPWVGKLGKVMIGNKVDIKDRQVKAKDITLHRQINCQYYDLSVRNAYNFEKPLLYLIRNITHNPNIDFTETVLPSYSYGQ